LKNIINSPAEPEICSRLFLKPNLKILDFHGAINGFFQINYKYTNLLSEHTADDKTHLVGEKKQNRA